MTETVKWRTDGVTVVRAKSLDMAMRGPSGTGRASAFDFTGSGGRETWIGTVTLQPKAKTGAHHHGRHEVAVYGLGYSPPRVRHLALGDGDRGHCRAGACPPPAPGRRPVRVAHRRDTRRGTSPRPTTNIQDSRHGRRNLGDITRARRGYVTSMWRRVAVASWQSEMRVIVRITQGTSRHFALLPCVCQES